jgi:hypothetical protein
MRGELFAALTPKHAGATVAARKQTERPSIVHTSLYLPEPVYEALRKIAFEERLKIHDVVLEGSIWHCGGVGTRRLRASRRAKSDSARCTPW